MSETTSSGPASVEGSTITRKPIPTPAEPSREIVRDGGIVHTSRRDDTDDGGMERPEARS